MSMPGAFPDDVFDVDSDSISTSSNREQEADGFIKSLTEFYSSMQIRQPTLNFAHAVVDGEQSDAPPHSLIPQNDGAGDDAIEAKSRSRAATSFSAQGIHAISARGILVLRSPTTPKHTKSPVSNAGQSPSMKSNHRPSPSVGSNKSYAEVVKDASSPPRTPSPYPSPTRLTFGAPLSTFTSLSPTRPPETTSSPSETSSELAERRAALFVKVNTFLAEMYSDYKPKSFTMDLVYFELLNAFHRYKSQPPTIQAYLESWNSKGDDTEQPPTEQDSSFITNSTDTEFEPSDTDDAAINHTGSPTTVNEPQPVRQRPDLDPRLSEMVNHFVYNTSNRSDRWLLAHYLGDETGEETDVYVKIRAESNEEEDIKLANRGLDHLADLHHQRATQSLEYLKNETVKQGLNESIDALREKMKLLEPFEVTDFRSRNWIELDKAAVQLWKVKQSLDMGRLSCAEGLEGVPGASGRLLGGSSG